MQFIVLRLYLFTFYVCTSKCIPLRCIAHPLCRVRVPPVRIYEKRHIIPICAPPVKVCEKRHIIRERKAEYVRRERDILDHLSRNSRRDCPFFIRLYCTFQDEERLCILWRAGEGSGISFRCIGLTGQLD